MINDIITEIITDIDEKQDEILSNQNLLMHSDYFSTMKPRVRIFLDRIEFMNPGALPKDVESIIKEEFTQPRNTIIARIFRAIKLAENAGSGFDKMFTGWKSYYNNAPKVSGDVDYYKIEFYFDSVKTSEKTSQKIIQLIKQNPAISAKEIAEQIGKTSRTVEMQIAKLKEEGIIKRIGPDKGGYWKVIRE